MRLTHHLHTSLTLNARAEHDGARSPLVRLPSNETRRLILCWVVVPMVITFAVVAAVLWHYDVLELRPAPQTFEGP